MYVTDENGAGPSTSAETRSIEEPMPADDGAFNDSTSTMDISRPNMEEEDEEQTRLRKQIVSLGKQPKAQQGRKKKDMVSWLFIIFFEPGFLVFCAIEFDENSYKRFFFRLSLCSIH